MAQNFKEVEQLVLAALVPPHVEASINEDFNLLEVTVFVHEITSCSIWFICSSTGHERIFFESTLQNNHTFNINLDRFYNCEDLEGFKICSSFEVLAEFETPSWGFFSVKSNSFPI